MMSTKNKNNIGIAIIILFSSILLSQFISEYICFKATVEGVSMESTYYNGDKVIVLRVGRIKRGNIVVARDPDTEKLIIKRCIGLPGDKIKIKDSIVYVNGQPLEDNYSKGLTYEYNIKEELTLGDSEYFLLGDNRENSRDSRYFGAITKRNIFGIVIN